MKIRAAVLEESGSRSSSSTSSSQARRPGEVLVRARGLRRLPHRSLHGQRPTRRAIRRACSGIRARAWSRTWARGDAACAGRPRDHALRPRVAECVHCLQPAHHRCIAIREQQALGDLPDGTRGGRAATIPAALHGHLDVAEATATPEIARAKVSPGRPSRGQRASSPAASPPGPRRLLHGPGRARDHRRGIGCGLVGLGAVAGCRLRGRRADHRDRPLGGAPRAWHAITAPPHTTLAAMASSMRSSEITGGSGCDYTFEATGHVQVMRQAVESAREAWGLAR